ncbi:STE like transcription factor-domain-containing protein [Mycena vulgaris]|nr:STE like transcription factor-domain-containing protein [Mycena vulgaris]
MPTTDLDRLRFFATAPSRWDGDDDAAADAITTTAHPALNRFLLSSQEYVSCVLWNGLYHTTGPDIVRTLVFRFEVSIFEPFVLGGDGPSPAPCTNNMKKFQEGVFSDLCNLKPHIDASLEEPKYQCIPSQKMQKVFYWFSVPHNRLFLDALERDLKREKMGLEPTTHITGEPALSFIYDDTKSLYNQFVVGRVDEVSCPGARKSFVSASGSASERDDEAPVLFLARFSLLERKTRFTRRRPGWQHKPLRLGLGLGAGEEEERRGWSRHPLQDMLAALQAQVQQPLRSREDSMREAYAATQQLRMQRGAHNAGAVAPGSDATGAAPKQPKTKVFFCPLCSCGRLFKRMEHVRRHLHTHTVERPFACARCNKRFWSINNANRHLRTLVRVEGGGDAGSRGDEGGGEGEEVDELLGDEDREI